MWEHWVNLFPGLAIPNSVFDPPTEDKIIECNSFEDVRIYTAPWVAGYCARSYYAPIEVKLQDYNVERGIHRVEEKIKKLAFNNGANAVVAVSTDVYIWESPIKFNAFGTPTCLSKL
jgi:hypothetical protein